MLPLNSITKTGYISGSIPNGSSTPIVNDLDSTAGVILKAYIGGASTNGISSGKLRCGTKEIISIPLQNYFSYFDGALECNDDINIVSDGGVSLVGISWGVTYITGTYAEASFPSSGGGAGYDGPNYYDWLFMCMVFLFIFSFANWGKFYKFIYEIWK